MVMGILRVLACALRGGTRFCWLGNVALFLRRSVCLCLDTPVQRYASFSGPVKCLMVGMRA